MSSTRLRVNTGVQVYHRFGPSGDMALTDTGTSDANVQGLGGSGDLEIEADTTLDYTTAHKVQNASVAVIGSGTIDKFIHIKNTGFTSSTKATATTQGLKVGLGSDTAVTTYFTLEPGESICLHGLGAACNTLAELYLDSESGDIYAEIVYH
jgi:urease alpha subunit